VSVSLLDVNVLVAIALPRHSNHDAAHQWLEAHQTEGWATCPLTINGCVRIVSSEAVSAAPQSPGEVAGRLREFCQSPHHHFWPDDVSLLDEERFDTSTLAGPRQITDAYLLGLAVKHRGRLVTFDRNIAVHVVRGAEAKHLCLLGAPAKRKN
jgi:uncharacterized protein